MFAAYRNPARAYAGVAMETSVVAARPIDLVVMLYDGAIENITRAIGYMQEKKMGPKGEAITRAIRIINEGLRGALDPNAAPISNNLRDLYDYMALRLLQGSLKNDPAMLGEVRKLLLEVKSAWDELAREPQPGAGAPAQSQARRAYL